MWILELLPDSLLLFFTNAVLLLGIALVIAGLVVQRIPVLWRYQLPFKIAGLIVFAAGIYFRGGLSVEMTWRDRVHELEQKLKLAEAESAKVNEKIVEKIVYRDRVIQKQGQTLIERVEVIKEVENCRVPQEAIEVHNEAARMNKIIEEQRKGRK